VSSAVTVVVVVRRPDRVEAGKRLLRDVMWHRQQEVGKLHLPWHAKAACLMSLTLALWM